MRILFFFMLALSCFPTLAKEVLLDSYGIKTWSFLGFKYIESFSRLYGESGRDFSFTNYASVDGWPKIRIFVASNNNEVDAVDLQARINEVYRYLQKLTGETPPAKRIDIYLVPCGYDFMHAKKSLSIGANAKMDFAFSVDANGRCHSYSISLSRKIVRTLAHESMHTILNFHQPDKVLNEKAAVAGESCAELLSFGDASFAKRVRLEKVAADQQNTPINVSLRAKYDDDEELAAISSYETLFMSNVEGANKLFALCSDRYQRALMSAQ